MRGGNGAPGGNPHGHMENRTPAMSCYVNTARDVKERKTFATLLGLNKVTVRINRVV